MTDEQFSLIQSHDGHDSPIAPRVVSQPGYSLAKVENADDMLLIGEAGLPVLSRNFRSKKRNRVMQSCVACHSQKRKCDRKRPCTRCTEHGIAGQCVYQLEDPVLREGPEQDELLRLRTRVADLEHTVRVLMQKPLSKRAAAALEAETDAILGTTSSRKRKVDRENTQDRATKAMKTGFKSHDQDDLAEWLPLPDAALPSPVDSTSAFSPYATTPADSYYLSSYGGFADGITPPCDVPTPPYSTFPTPSSDADSPFRYTMESFGRRYSDGGTLANMLSHGMTVESPAFSTASSASPVAAMSMHNHSSGGTSLNCGCGSNPIGSEVLQGVETNIDVGIDVLKALPDHQHGNHCNLLQQLVDALDMIRAATNASSASAISASPTFPPSSSMPPPPPPPQAAQPVMAPSPAYMSPAPSHPVSHVSPASEPGASPHSTVASPPNYLLHNPRTAPAFHHTDVPTVSGFSSLGSWASFRGSTSYPVQSPMQYGGNSMPHISHQPQRSRSSSLVVYGQDQR